MKTDFKKKASVTVQALTQKEKCDFHQLAFFCRILEKQSLKLKQLDWLLQDQHWTLTVQSDSGSSVLDTEVFIEESLKTAFPESKIIKDL